MVTNVYDEDLLYIQELSQLMEEEGIENLQTLVWSGYKLNPSQREHLICLGVDPDNFENQDLADKEDFLDGSSPDEG